MLSGRVFYCCVAASMHWPLLAQSVVSVRSAVVHYFEGSVSVDGLALENKFGRFYEIKDGSELRTEDGRAEVLLTPGAILRVDRNSAIRLRSNRLQDTRVEFGAGSASVEVPDGAPAGAVSLLYKNYQIRFRTSGVYRIDSPPGELRVEKGQAEVSTSGHSIVAAEGQTAPFAVPLQARPAPARQDSFDLWATDRRESIVADNAAAANSDTLTQAMQQDPTGTFAVGSLPTFQPAPNLQSGSAAWLSMPSPYQTLYPGILFRYNYIPLYRQRLGIGAYRPLTPPTQVRPYTPPIWHPPVRTGPPAVLRGPAASPGAATTHRGAVGHR
ncbi:MAG TPA: hypothetical protein VFA28_07435 [Bryobacteraceae bacterium]|nr:hypothetical protein [Bryobacteraceae bacterium]